jgi:demethylmenaquinone methyltransferase/2-methoxy-6-polyprenyl-1,4-benzoquinol methylase
MTRADLAKNPRDVAAMFDGVARRYDLTNDVLSGYQTRRWRSAVAAAVAPRPGERILDLAAGTGTSSLPLAAAGALVVSCDFSLGMLQQGRRQYPGLSFVAGDGLALPFRDGTFDAVTISFGLRNLVDTSAGLRELLRVTRPGGRVVVCEFSTPTNPAVRTVYLEYLMRALPEIAERTASNPDAYGYLADSIRAWPDQEELSALIYRAGWRRVAYRNLTGGIVALHRAVRPAGEQPA